LPNFISAHHSISELGIFANLLRTELNRKTVPQWLEEEPSGFHLLGYNKDGIPEFWYFGNATWDGTKYKDMQLQFGDPTSDFLERDAKNLGWDGRNPESIADTSGVVTYRNGDFRIHEVMWEKLDAVFDYLDRFNDFRIPKGNGGIEPKTKFKLKLIAQFYQEWAKTKLVGGEPNVIVRSYGLT
jgi:hypothetical protein